jgi:hypothetical protein
MKVNMIRNLRPVVRVEISAPCEAIAHRQDNATTAAVVSICVGLDHLKAKGLIGIVI